MDRRDQSKFNEQKELNNLLKRSINIFYSSTVFLKIENLLK